MDSDWTYQNCFPPVFLKPEFLGWRVKVPNPREAQAAPKSKEKCQGQARAYVCDIHQERTHLFYKFFERRHSFTASLK